ncbi:MAG TPA: glycosyltransferase family 4 protein [Terrimicrobiaceae bacterium]
MLIEFGERRFATTRNVHEGISYLYVPTVINRIINAVHTRVLDLWRRISHANPQTLRPAYASTLHNLGFAVQAAWHARKWHADVIHVHNFSQFVPIVRALNPSARIVLHMNCEWLSQLDPKMIARRIKSVDAIIGCSGHIVNKVLARFPYLRQKCHVVFNGSDVEHFVPSMEAVVANPPDPLRILFVGRISPEKGLHLLVDAFKTVAQNAPTACLDVVGGAGSLPADYIVSLSDDPNVRGLESFYRGDYFAEIQGRIPDHLKERVKFHGNVAHRDLAEHYARATVFVNSSLSDAFPLTVVEAMAAGLPIVASAVGGVPEAVAHETTGFLVKPNSSDALASSLCDLLNDSSLRRRMAVAARERALSLFSWNAIAGQVARVHDQAAAVNGTK